MFGNVLFFAETETDVDTFVREYVLGAIDRVERSEFCDGITFDRDEELNPDGGSVVLTVLSDFEDFVERERERWQEHREAGIIEDWETRPASEEGLERRFGARGGELALRLLPLGGRMSRLAYEEFEDDSFPPADDAYPDEEGVTPVGWWMVLHHLTVGNLGYSPREELQMFRAAADEDLRLIAEREGPQAVDDEIDDLKESLEEMRAVVKEGRPGS